MPERIAAVVLAAGMSKRMGRPKALLPMGGSAMIVRVLASLVENGSIDPVVVVTGHEAQQIRSIIDIPRIEFVHNSQYEAGGMLSSVKVGCQAIRDRCDWLFLVLGDQPLVRKDTYKALVGLLNREAAGGAPLPVANPLPDFRMIQPTFGARRGHPILFRSDCIPEIFALPDDATLKTFTQRINDLCLVEVNDEGVVTDIDTPEDYDRALAQFQAHRSESCKSKV